METSPCTRCGSRQRSAGYGLCAQCLLAAALHTAELPTDDRFGNYEPVALLGEGGMGIIYLAEQTAPLRRTVALKVLKEGSGGRGFKERFDRERQSLARLGHPHIAAIYDAGTSQQGVPFFVMEYVEGSPITTWCNQRRLSLPQRLGLFQQVCQAVEHAHQRGILHRDLKPSNLLIADSNGVPQAKVIDFGLARLEDWHGFSREQLTGVAQIMGTPEYMSPEQAAGLEAEIDRQTDVYSLGIVLYELLAGALPWDQSTWGTRSAAEILHVVRELDLPAPEKRFRALAERCAQIAAERDTDARALARELAGDLGTILRKATQRETEHRYPSAEALSADINRYLQGEPVEARRGDRAYRISKWVRRHRAALGVAALFCVVLALVTSVYFATRPLPGLEVEGLTPFTAFDGYETSPSLSPDGKSMVFTWDGPARENFDLYVVHSPGEPPRRLTTSPAADLSPAWSPDGRTIAFLRGSEPVKCSLILLDLATGKETKLRELRVWYARYTRNLSWTADGKWLVFLENGSTGHSVPRLLSPQTGEIRPLMAAPAKAEYLQPAISPDGRSLAYLVDDLQSQHIWVQPLSADYSPVGEPRMIAPGKFPAWLPHGDLLFQSWQGGRPRVWHMPATGGELKILDQLGDRIVEVSTSLASNAIALCRNTFNADAWNFHLDGLSQPQGPVAVAASTHDELDPEISPDGRHLAFVSGRSGTRQIWIAALDGSALRQMTFGDSVRRGPNWLPDGRTIRFGTRNEEVRKFWLLDTVTGNVEHERDDIYIEYTTPDGKWMFYRQAVGEQNRLFRAPVDNPGAGKPVVARPCFHSSVDPSGKWIYFNDRISGPAGIWRVATDGSTADTLVAEQVHARAFAVSASGIYFARQASPTRFGLFYQPFTAGAPTLLKEIDRRPTGRITVSPDGRELVIDVAVQEGDDLLLATLAPR